MAIYVDDARTVATVGNVTGEWSHLFCHPNSPEGVKELIAFGERLGLKAKWLHRRTDGLMPHFDVVESKRFLAIQMGATKVSTRRVVEMMKEQRKSEQIGLWPHTGG